MNGDMDDIFQGSSGHVGEKAPYSYTKPVEKFESLFIERYKELSAAGMGDVRNNGYFHISNLAKFTDIECPRYMQLHLDHEVKSTGIDLESYLTFKDGETFAKVILEIFEPYILGSWKCKQCGTVNVPNNTQFDQVTLEQIYSSKKTYFTDKPIHKPDACGCGCGNFEYHEWRVFDPDTQMGGSVDFIFKMFDKIYVTEIKTENVMTYLRSSNPMSGKRLKYALQAALYRYVCNKATPNFYADEVLVIRQCKSAPMSIAMFNKLNGTDFQTDRVLDFFLYKPEGLEPYVQSKIALCHQVIAATEMFPPLPRKRPSTKNPKGALKECCRTVKEGEDYAYTIDCPYLYGCFPEVRKDDSEKEKRKPVEV